ncbi:glycosyltransferase [Persicitalea jodogahamensis]|uniref:Glycosyltransferase 2-like domain-containing protein n=1 Tax=Persicitalea jodogahamensis TaxID=402147 RepID=A0A8J3G8U7_9BACT|nr:glycosyltransferase [Persicitalea jodogahamensis]GHB61454.1 hypothetical protein GCM10007390_14120 [Persicitalea jodogahamensis]
MHTHSFPEITLLISHYNRSQSLARLVHLVDELGLEFGNIIVTDDGSRPEHVEKLQNLQREKGFTLLTVPKNMGMGHNFNKGQDAVKTEYTLFIEEDFVPNPSFVPALSKALSILKENPEMDIARFYAYFKYPYLRPIGDGFAEMQFSPFKAGYRKFFMYSDHPHLRRSTFFQKFGRFREDTRPDKTEYLMMMSFLHNKGKGVFFEAYQDLLTQSNSSEEPSTISREFWRQTDNIFVTAARNLYRHFKMNRDYLMGRK